MIIDYNLLLAYTVLYNTVFKLFTKDIKLNKKSTNQFDV